MFHKILVAYDGSPGADAALARALEAARQASKELWLVSVQAGVPDVAPPPTAPVSAAPTAPPSQSSFLPRLEADQATEHASQHLARLQSEAEQTAVRAGVKLHTDTVAGNVAKSIVEYAATGAFDLLVIGQTGQSGVWGTFLGTTADKVVRHAPCSVLVVRRSDAQPATAPKPATVPAAPPEGTVTCRTCGEENPATALLCARCRDVLPRPL